MCKEILHYDFYSINDGLPPGIAWNIIELMLLTLNILVEHTIVD